MKGKWKFVYLNPIVWFLVIWLLSLGKCELFTLLHGNEFANAYKENSMLGDMAYWKVLDYSQNNARVYYVSSGLTDGDILCFTKENGKWESNKWITVWSTSGNADNTIWPYWWHFFYSHPRL